eukprot:CAMPEP_0113272336 /NCGR_PEP_ID=MMETSP0008_2-20120614/23269_1 /TAXON_ID=97485 /ORGANISM="Prymnesium parvum" /LENGTH=57 /DNA_ID=CAMNT_0000121791 /DNA_START=158 /DNA_END=331 /DNA_ORIENTATION=- /assembly_acc=CAM_ASM_000153
MSGEEHRSLRHAYVSRALQVAFAGASAKSAFLSLNVSRMPPIVLFVGFVTKVEYGKD